MPAKATGLKDNLAGGPLGRASSSLPEAAPSHPKPGRGWSLESGSGTPASSRGAMCRVIGRQLDVAAFLSFKARRARQAEGAKNSYVFQ